MQVLAVCKPIWKRIEQAQHFARACKISQVFKADVALLLEFQLMHLRDGYACQVLQLL